MPEPEVAAAANEVEEESKEVAPEEAEETKVAEESKEG